MTTTPSTADLEASLGALSKGKLVVGVDLHSQTWIGNEFVLLRQGPVTVPSAESISEVTEVGDMVPLEQCHAQSGHAMFLRVADRLVRMFERPDGVSVCVDDRFCALIGRSANNPVSYQQEASGPLGRILVFEGKATAPIAVVMPMRVS